jgi:hypothetical protein
LLRRLADFPYVLVRLRCDLCKRAGSYRLARLAVKFGSEILLFTRAPLGRLSLARRSARKPVRRFFSDLPPRRPPDIPVRKRLRVVSGGKSSIAVRMPRGAAYDGQAPKRAAPLGFALKDSCGDRAAFRALHECRDEGRPRKFRRPAARRTKDVGSERHDSEVTDVRPREDHERTGDVARDSPGGDSC